MPLTAKGQEIEANMEKTYGPKKGEQVFYASENAGKIKGVHKDMANDVDNPKPASGPMATSGPNGTSESLPKTVEPFKDAAQDGDRDCGRAMSLDEIKSSAKRIGRY